MLVAVAEPAKTIIAVAAFTGARAGEIEGMVWENYRKSELFVSAPSDTAMSPNQKPMADIVRLTGFAAVTLFPFTLAQRALWAAAIRARPSADILRRGLVPFVTSVDPGKSFQRRIQSR